MTWRLKRTAQCHACPWLKSTDPHNIPNGYCETKHAALISTIAEPGSLHDTGRSMACHESHSAHCIGWLVNQIGPGNNIPLRMRMRNCENAGKIKLRGEARQERLILDEELRERLMRAVDKLTAQELAVLQACFWNDMKASEAADMLELKVERLSVIKSRVIRYLREQLA